MAERVPKQAMAGGGWSAIFYFIGKAFKAGPFAFARRMSSRNACKTCALGMGGQKGGMRDEKNAWPEVCKKSAQAQAADMQQPITEAFFKTHSLTDLESWNSRALESAGRIAFPLYAPPGATHYRRISWEEAVQRIAGKLRDTDPQRAFFYMSGRSSNEAGFLLQTFARAWGTNHINNCSFYCHQASGTGLARVLGSSTATVSLDDLHHADLAVIIGANPASNHPRLMTRLIELRQRGGKIMVINPIKEAGLVRFRLPKQPGSLLFGSQVSDLYLQPRVGGDIALLKGVAKLIVEMGHVDQHFIQSYTQGWEEYEQDLQQTSWEEIESGCGLTRAAIQPFADLYLGAKNAIFMWAMGITHHYHGVHNVQTIANLALIRGMAGRVGAGLMPLRGHSNIQGIGSMGVTPALKTAFATAVERELGIVYPSMPGWTTYESMVAAQEGKVDFALMLGGNLLDSNPDAVFSERALKNIKLAVYINTTLNAGHLRGRGQETIVLPARARDEEFSPTTQESMFNYVRLSEGGFKPPGKDVRSEVEIVSAIAQQVLPPSKIPWAEFTDHRVLRRAMAKIVPGYEQLADIDSTRREFTVGNRVYHEPHFSTPDGKARLTPIPIPHESRNLDEFSLVTIRSEGQFNTVVYEEQDIYRGQTRRDVVMINSHDAERLGFRENETVRVRSECGVMDNITLRLIDVSLGTAVMYYPESNRLVARRIDPDSGTPSFKNTPIQIERIAPSVRTAALSR